MPTINQLIILIIPKEKKNICIEIRKLTSFFMATYDSLINDGHWRLQYYTADLAIRSNQPPASCLYN